MGGGVRKALKEQGMETERNAGEGDKIRNKIRT